MWFSFDIGEGSVSRRSVAVGGGVPDGASTEPSSNEDGTIVAFTSEATNLVLGDSNGVADVFSVDAGGTIERISHGVLGEGDAPSGQPSIASGSNTISFSSSASNLVVGDTNAVVDIFVHTPGLQYPADSEIIGKPNSLQNLRRLRSIRMPPESRS